MKASIFDESGKRIYRIDGDPNKCIKDILQYMKNGMQTLNWDEIINHLDILNLAPEFERARLKRKIEIIQQREREASVQ